MRFSTARGWHSVSFGTSTDRYCKAILWQNFHALKDNHSSSVKRLGSTVKVTGPQSLNVRVSVLGVPFWLEVVKRIRLRRKYRSVRCKMAFRAHGFLQWRGPGSYGTGQADMAWMFFVSTLFCEIRYGKACESFDAKRGMNLWAPWPIRPAGTASSLKSSALNAITHRTAQFSQWIVVRWRTASSPKEHSHKTNGFHFVAAF